MAPGPWQLGGVPKCKPQWLSSEGEVAYSHISSRLADLETTPKGGARKKQILWGVEAQTGNPGGRGTQGLGCWDLQQTTWPLRASASLSVKWRYNSVHSQCWEEDDVRPCIQHSFTITIRLCLIILLTAQMAAGESGSCSWTFVPWADWQFWNFHVDNVHDSCDVVPHGSVGSGPPPKLGSWQAKATVLWTMGLYWEHPCLQGFQNNG